MIPAFREGLVEDRREDGSRVGGFPGRNLEWVRF